MSADKKTSARQWARDMQGAVEAEEAEARAIWERRTGKLLPPKPYPRRASRSRPRIGKTILVVGDSHMDPQHDNRRMEWLGHAVTDINPDYLICMGDAWSMNSMSTHSRAGSKEFEGKRYWEDIDAGIDGRLRTQKVLDDYNRNRAKKDRVNPRKIALVGNHEHRITTFVDSEHGRKFAGLIGLHDLRQTEPELGGWEQIPFLQTIEVEGINFSHYFSTGLMSRATSSTNSLLNKTHVTCIAGHSHLYSHSVGTGADGLARHAIMAGCFFERSEGWAQQANLLWRRGLLVLRDCDGLGDFGHEWLTMNQVEAKYG